MTANLSNRFTEMFDKTGVTGRKPKLKKVIDFGASLGDDESINSTFRSLHEETVKPVIIDPVNVQPPVVENVVIRHIDPSSTVQKSDSSEPILSSAHLLKNEKYDSYQSPSSGLSPRDFIEQPIGVNNSAPKTAETNIILSDRLTVTPSDYHTVEPSHSHTVQQLDSQTVIQSDGFTVGQPDGRTVERHDAQTVSQSHSHTAVPSYGQTVTHRDTSRTAFPGMNQNATTDHIPLDVLTLPYNQACVLEYLCKAGGTTSYRDIFDHTNVKMPSARDAVTRLIQKGFMGPLVTLRNAAFQGFTYVLNEKICSCFLAAGGLERNTYQTIPQTVRPSNNHTVEQLDGSSLHSSSIVLETITTTNSLADRQTVEPSDCQTVRRSDGERFVLVGPESAYWEDIGLQERQTLKWCDEFEVSPNDLRQQLAWARWDLVQNGKEADVTKDAISWFFGCLRKTAGCYPRPDNYQSPAELRASRIKLQQEKINEAQSALMEVELGKKLQVILSNPQSGDYRDLYEQASSFAREQGGFALETEMKSLFLEKNGIKNP